MKLFTFTAICAAALLATAAQATPATPSFERAAASGALQQLLAREAESGGDDGKGHRLNDEIPGSQVASEAESGDDRGNDGKGHRLSEELRGDLIARAETSHGGKRRPAGKGGV